MGGLPKKIPKSPRVTIIPSDDEDFSSDEVKIDIDPEIDLSGYDLPVAPRNSNCLPQLDNSSKQALAVARFLLILFTVLMIITIVIAIIGIMYPETDILWVLSCGFWC